jgi:hypothetical protein
MCKGLKAMPMPNSDDLVTRAGDNWATTLGTGINPLILPMAPSLVDWDGGA